MQVKRGRQTAYVVLTIAVTVAISGYFVGLRQSMKQADTARETHRVSEGEQKVAGESKPTVRTNTSIPKAVSYSEMARSHRRYNVDWSHADEIPPPDVFERDSTSLFLIPSHQRELLSQERLDRRAYVGAPPVIPHPIDEHSSASCLACHGFDRQIAGRIAPKMNHPYFPNCTQCHVPSAQLDQRDYHKQMQEFLKNESTTLK